MILDESSIGGELVGAHKHPVRKFPSGRVCEQEGCLTRLSVYNGRARCALHDFDAGLVHFHVSVPRATTKPSWHGHVLHEAA